MLDGEYAARLVCVNENLVIAATKLKDHNAAKFLDMGFQLYGAIHLLIWLSMCLFMGLFTDMFFFFPRTFLTAENLKVRIGLLDCFYTGQSPGVLTVFRAGQSPARSLGGAGKSGRVGLTLSV